MKRRWTLVAVAATAIVSAGATVAVAGPGGGSDNAPVASANAVPNAAVDTAVESSFTAIAPCRVVDTREAGGVIAAATGRVFTVTGSGSFSGQGGSSTGCGIPSAATAIAANVVAVTPTGLGYLRGWAPGTPVPTASFLNYAGNAITSTGTVLPITGSGASNLALSANVTGTNVVVDVTGYYVKQMQASVSSTGVLLRGSRVTGVVYHPDTTDGSYEVDFDRDVTGCTYAATSTQFRGLIGLVQPRSGVANGVYVQFATDTATRADSSFMLTVTC